MLCWKWLLCLIVFLWFVNVSFNTLNIYYFICNLRHCYRLSSVKVIFIFLFYLVYEWNFVVQDNLCLCISVTLWHTVKFLGRSCFVEWLFIAFYVFVIIFSFFCWYTYLLMNKNKTLCWLFKSIKSVSLKFYKNVYKLYILVIGFGYYF